MEEIFRIALLDKRTLFNSKHELDLLFDVICNNSFSGFNTYELNRNEEMITPVDIEVIKSKFIKKKDISVAFYSNDPYFLSGRFNKTEDYNTMVFILDKQYLRNDNHRLNNFFLHLIKALPNFTVGKSHIIPDISDFYYYNQIPAVPSGAFRTYVDPLHFVAPREYLKHFTREELLNIPSYKVTEHPDGVIEIQYYEDIFDYKNPENIETMRKVNEYLRSCWKDENGIRMEGYQ